MRKRPVGWRGKLRRYLKKHENQVCSVPDLAAHARVSEDIVRIFAREERRGGAGRLGRDLVPDRNPGAKVCAVVLRPAGDNDIFWEAEGDYELNHAIRHVDNRNGIKVSCRTTTGHALTTSLDLKALTAHGSN